jgi:hypothetical protein
VREGINLDVSFKKENITDSIVDIMAATIGQGFSLVESPTSGYTYQPPEQDPGAGR